MPRILHVSDLHFGPPHLPRLAEALLEIAPALSPDVIVASGDFTQRAKQHQFREARAFLDRLPDVPTVAVPGNHDVPLYRVFERLFDPYRHYHASISSERNGSLTLPGLVLVFLDSSAPRRAVTNGRIDEGQLRLCDEVFGKAPSDAYRVVVAHHHLVPAPDYEHDQVLPGSRRIIDRFESLGVDCVLGGHLHRAYIGNSLDVYPGADRRRGVIFVQCGTTTSRRGRAREREKNSLNVIDLADDEIRVSHYLYFDQASGFVPSSRHLFPRSGRHLGPSHRL